MLNETSSEQARLSLAGPFGLVFTPQGDRLGHGLIGPAGSRFMIHSVELADEAAATGPASPVFQEVHSESLAQGPSLMTVGQWGKIHFSGVFLRAEPGMVHCDIAARVRQPGPVQLASTYALSATSSDLISADEREIICRIPQSEINLRLTAGRGSRLVLAEAGRSALRVQIMPWPTDSGQAAPALARTIQWNYTLALVNAEDLV